MCVSEARWCARRTFRTGHLAVLTAVIVPAKERGTGRNQKETGYTPPGVFSPWGTEDALYTLSKEMGTTG